MEPLPPWLCAVGHHLVESAVFPIEPNHVLVNEYDPGQGILPHEDGPLYFPQVAIVSLGSGLVLDFLSKHSRERVESVLLQPRSLFIFRDDAYRTYLHTIAERTTDFIDEKVVNIHSVPNVQVGSTIQRTRRVSLTIRIVRKVRAENK